MRVSLATIALLSAAAAAGAEEEPPNSELIFGEDFPRLHWYRVPNGPHLPMMSGCDGAQPAPHPLPRYNASLHNAQLDWAPAHFITIEPDRVHVILGLRPSSFRYGPVRGDVLWSGDNGVTWWCLGRDDAKAGRAGAVAFHHRPTPDPNSQQQMLRSICVAGGRRYVLESDNSYSVQAATDDVSCLSIGPPLVNSSSAGSADGAASPPGPPTVSWHDGAPLPAPAVGLTHVAIDDDALACSQPQHLLIGGLRQDGSAGLWRIQWKAVEKQQSDAANSSGVPSSAVVAIPSGWQQIALVADSEAAVAYRRTGGLALWLPSFQRLLFGGGSLDMRTNFSSTGSPFMQSNAVTSVEVWSGTASTAAPLVSLVLWDVLPSLTSGAPLLPAPAQALELPMASSRYAFQAYSLSLMPPQVVALGDPLWQDTVLSPPPSQLAHLYFQRGGAAYLLRLYKPVDSPSSSSSSSSSPVLLKEVQLEHVAGMGAELIVMQATRAPMLAAAQWTRGTENSSSSSSSSSSRDGFFPHVFAFDSGTNEAFWGSPLACVPTTGCPLGTHPAHCTFSPWDSGCAACQECNYEESRGWWCGWSSHSDCAFDCVPCPEGTTTVSFCNDVLSRNLTHDTCEPWRPSGGGVDFPPDTEGSGGEHGDGGTDSGANGGRTNRNGDLTLPTGLQLGIWWAVAAETAAAAAVVLSLLLCVGSRTPGKATEGVRVKGRSAGDFSGSRAIAKGGVSFVEETDIDWHSGRLNNNSSSATVIPMHVSGTDGPAYNHSSILHGGNNSSRGIKAPALFQRPHVRGGGHDVSGGGLPSVSMVVRCWLGIVALTASVGVAAGSLKSVAGASAGVCVLIATAWGLLIGLLQWWWTDHDDRTTTILWAKPLPTALAVAMALLLPPAAVGGDKGNVAKRSGSSGGGSGGGVLLAASAAAAVTGMTSCIALAVLLHLSVSSRSQPITGLCALALMARLAATADGLRLLYTALSARKQAVATASSAVSVLLNPAAAAVAVNGSSLQMGPASTGVDVAVMPQLPSGTDGAALLASSSASRAAGDIITAVSPVSRPGGDVSALLSELMWRAQTPEGKRLAGHRIFFRRNPQLLPTAVAAVQKVPLPEAWRNVLHSLDMTAGAEAPLNVLASVGPLSDSVRVMAINRGADGDDDVVDYNAQGYGDAVVADTGDDDARNEAHWREDCDDNYEDEQEDEDDGDGNDDDDDMR